MPEAAESHARSRPSPIYWIVSLALAGILRGDGQVRYIEVHNAQTLHSREVKTAVSMALYDDDTHGFRSRALG